MVDDKQKWITIVAQLHDTPVTREIVNALLTIAPTVQGRDYVDDDRDAGKPQVHIADGWGCTRNASDVSIEYQRWGERAEAPWGPYDE